MQESTSAHPPEGSGRRAWFPRRSAVLESEPQPIAAPVSLERAVEERLAEGLRAIQEQAAALMREIATELWRASGGDTSDAQERILSFLSRDQAIRSLITTSDERFQSLAVRTARFEDVLTEVADLSRATREAIQLSAAAIREVAESPAVHGVESVRNQLELVEHHIAAAFQHLDERDRALVEGIESRVGEHGELIARETTRIVEAMQGYVQSGTEAVGRLAQRVEAHAQAFAVHDDDISERLRGVIREQIGGFAEQLELTAERIGIDQRDARQALERMQNALEARVYGLAQLVRSDSEALRKHVDRTAAAQEERMSAQIETRVAALARAAEEQVSALTMAVSAVVERKLASVSIDIEERLGGISEAVARDTAEAAGASVRSALDGVLDQVSSSSRVIEAARVSLDETKGLLEETSGSLERGFTEPLDERITALAKLIRSDNRVIAEALTQGGQGGESETAKQTLRAVKELHASLAADVDGRFQTMAEQLHRESQSTVETMAKVAEVLADRIGRLSAKVDDVYGKDLPVVVERMSDAISAMSALGRRQ